MKVGYIGGGTLNLALLELSANPVDGRELVGKDPRLLKADELALAGIIATPVLSAIRAKCLDCSCGNSAEVRKCVATSCALWPFRMGSNPFRAPLSEEQRLARSRSFALRMGRQSLRPADSAEENETSDPDAG